ncbi:MAG: hypothetical protein GX589_10890 [Deltaproteobacteria bacterium]|nr:hypothetical protein [Deltaproteobacteria bacterium]
MQTVTLKVSIRVELLKICHQHQLPLKIIIYLAEFVYEMQEVQMMGSVHMNII